MSTNASGPGESSSMNGDRPPEPDAPAIGSAGFVRDHDVSPLPISMPIPVPIPMPVPEVPKLQRQSKADAAPPDSSVDARVPLQELSEGTLDPGHRKLADYLIQAMRELKAEGTNGWGEIASALKDVDDDKIGHCKEDLDTLLVFAGLFSAVLTAFVAESYQSLSPDPEDQVVQLLTQIALQTSGYTITASHANATASFPHTSSSFEPPVIAVHVNRLWFISLVLSLMTASFGILIKQWLREYRSVDSHHSNLRSRLRIRQFRYPALLTWKVFELAALLPLLVQLSLGLFFLGLCLFTWSINPSVGRSCAVLVSAWIFLFSATALAPVFSSHCPYKISLFSPVFPSLRSKIYTIWCLKWLYFGPRVPKSCRPWRELFALRIISRSVRAMWKLIPWALHLSKRNTPFSNPEWSRPLSLPKLNNLDREQTRQMPLEEKEIAVNDQQDLDMLNTVDDILLDDELLSTMRGVVMRSQFDPKDTMGFVRGVLARRLPQWEEYLSNQGCPVVDLRPLPLRAWEAIVHIICTTLQAHVTLDSSSSYRSFIAPSWMNEALTIILSRGVDDPTLAKRDLTMFAQYRCAVPQLSPGAFTGLSCSNILAHVQTFFHPGRFSKPEFINQLLRSKDIWQQTYDPHFRLRGHQSFSSHAKLESTDWADDFIFPFVQDIVHITRGLLDDRAAQQKVPVTSERSPYTSDNDMPELLDHTVIPWISSSMLARQAFAQSILGWVRDAPWSSIKYVFTASQGLRNELLWIIVGSSWNKYLYAALVGGERGCAEIDLTNPEQLDRDHGRFAGGGQAKVLRVLICTLVNYLRCDIEDPTMNHGAFPYMVIKLGLELFQSVFICKDLPYDPSTEDEWSTLLYLLGRIAIHYRRLTTNGRANAVNAQTVEYGHNRVFELCDSAASLMVDTHPFWQDRLKTIRGHCPAFVEESRPQSVSNSLGSKKRSIILSPTSTRGTSQATENSELLDPESESESERVAHIIRQFDLPGNESNTEKKDVAAAQSLGSKTQTQYFTRTLEPDAVVTSSNSDDSDAVFTPVGDMEAAIPQLEYLTREDSSGHIIKPADCEKSASTPVVVLGSWHSPSTRT